VSLAPQRLSYHPLTTVMSPSVGWWVFVVESHCCAAADRDKSGRRMRSPTWQAESARHDRARRGVRHWVKSLAAEAGPRHGRDRAGSMVSVCTVADLLAVVYTTNMAEARQAR
jgi:hypothetical protein